MQQDSSEFISSGNPEDRSWTINTTYYQLYKKVEHGKVMMVKTLRREYLSDKQMRNALEKEYYIGREVSATTPFVVRYLDCYTDAEEVSLTMDFVDGDTLDRFLVTHPSYFADKANLRRFLRQLLEGLLAIHQHKAIHLDLKPSNIMMTHINKDVCIIDLGFCYADTWPNQIGTTKDFAAPEMLDGTYDIDARTDIYSVGKILLYIELQLQQHDSTYRLPKDILHVCELCVRLRKSERWGSVEKVLDYLNDITRRLSFWRRAAIAASSILVVLVGLLSLSKLNDKPAEFVDENSIVYQVVSEDSATCRIIGSDSTQFFRHIYIRSNVFHNNKTYTVVAIADSAFQNNKLETLSLPQSLELIGKNAFIRCHQLEFVDIPDRVKTIGPQAFWHCQKLSSLRLPARIKEIPQGAFCFAKMKEVVVPEGVTSIGCDAFAGNEHLETVRLPETLSSIERGVFWKCSALKSITLPAKVHEIGVLAFYDCTSLTDIYNHSPQPQNVSKIFSPEMKVTVHVPKGSAELYREAYVWKEMNIVEM